MSDGQDNEHPVAKQLAEELDLKTSFTHELPRDSTSYAGSALGDVCENACVGTSHHLVHGGIQHGR